MSVDNGLAQLLRSYAAAAAGADAWPERVAVEVVRVDRFSSRATTPSGNVVMLDEPVIIGGTGKAADPAEHLLAAVGASVSVTLTAHAAMRGIDVSHVRIAMKATMDGKAFFAPGIGQTGLVEAELILHVEADEDTPQLRTLIDDAIAVAPVLQALKVEPRIEVRVERTR